MKGKGKEKGKGEEKGGGKPLTDSVEKSAIRSGLVEEEDFLPNTPRKEKNPGICTTPQEKQTALASSRKEKSMDER